jgi:hypothetical protein
MSEGVIEERWRFSEGTLAELRRRIATEVPELKNCPDLCVYATGSFARRDAWHHSDLDLFFVIGPDGPTVPQIRRTLINADLIRLCTAMGLPEFSGDGQYLVIHTLQSLVEELGSQKEDHENFFTARLLLLLESCPLCHDEVHSGLDRFGPRLGAAVGRRGGRQSEKAN